MRYIHGVIWLLGLEALTYCIFGYLSIYWGKKLNTHLREKHSQFYEENLDVPFLAGGLDVMKKHYHALKMAYWGTMPDELSNIYQKNMKHYAKFSIMILFALFVTIISFIAYIVTWTR